MIGAMECWRFAKAPVRFTAVNSIREESNAVTDRRLECRCGKNSTRDYEEFIHTVSDWRNVENFKWQGTEKCHVAVQLIEDSCRKEKKESLENVTLTLMISSRKAEQYSDLGDRSHGSFIPGGPDPWGQRAIEVAPDGPSRSLVELGLSYAEPRLKTWKCN